MPVHSQLAQCPLRRAALVAWALMRLHAVAPVRSPDGAEGWRWTSHDGKDLGHASGRHGSLPAMPDGLYEALDAECRWHAEDRSLLLAWALLEGYEAVPTLLYDEGADGWMWLAPDGGDLGCELGVHEDMPTMPDDVEESLARECPWIEESQGVPA